MSSVNGSGLANVTLGVGPVNGGSFIQNQNPSTLNQNIQNQNNSSHNYNSNSSVANHNVNNPNPSPSPINPISNGALPHPSLLPVVSIHSNINNNINNVTNLNNLSRASLSLNDHGLGLSLLPLPLPLQGDLGRLEFGQPINAASLNSERTQAVCAGKDLKIFDVRGHFLNNSKPIHLSSGGSTTTAIADVAWSPQPNSPWIVSAPTNGKLVLWNINKEGLKKPERLMEEHERTVNRVCWHPHDHMLLYSGSQDGHVKIWDLRLPGRNCVASFADVVSVRDVQVNPFNPTVFGAAYENGSIQIWDSRKSSRIVTVLGHQGLILSLDWHPEDKDILASGGVDRCVKVWDINEVREPKHTITSIASVGRIKWRPGRSYQIATASSLMDFNVHIWNVYSPNIPIASCTGHKDVVTGIIWRDSGDEIYSCSKDGTMQLHQVANGVLPYEHIRTCSIQWNVKGQLAFLHDDNKDKPNVKERNSLQVPIEFCGNYNPVYNAGFPKSQSRRQGSVRIFDAPTPALLDYISQNYFSLSDESAFLYFAENYRTIGSTVEEVCLYNAAVADSIMRIETAQVWRMIALLYKGVTFIQNIDSHPPIQHSNNNTSTQSANQVKASLNNHDKGEIDKKIYQFLDLSITAAALEVKQTKINNNYTGTRTRDPLGNGIPLGLRTDPNPHTLKGSESESLQSIDDNLNVNAISTGSILLSSLPHIHLSHCIHSRSSNTEKNSVSTLFSPHSSENFELINNLLNDACDRGDVQFCCIVLLILKASNIADLLQDQIPQSKTRVWFYAYLELLQRHQCYNAAAEIIGSCDDSDLRSLNQKSTTIALTCGKCKHASQHVGGLCRHCSSPLTACSVCQEPVQGLIVWCQGCGHGGHSDHMSEWFTEQSYCPTGCLHKCVPQLIQIRSGPNESILPTQQSLAQS